MHGSVIRLATAVVAVLGVTGCYTYVPPTTAPFAGSEVSVVLTDRGRVALGERVGPEMDQLRGRLLSSTDSTVVVSMRESVTLRGVSAKWTDEVLTLSREHFGSIRIRTLSRGRTSAVAGGAGAAAVLLVVNGVVNTGGSKVDQEPSKPPLPPGNNSKIGSLNIPFRSDF